MVHFPRTPQQMSLPAVASEAETMATPQQASSSYPRPEPPEPPITVPLVLNTTTTHTYSRPLNPWPPRPLVVTKRPNHQNNPLYPPPWHEHLFPATYGLPHSSKHENIRPNPAPPPPQPRPNSIPNIPFSQPILLPYAGNSMKPEVPIYTYLNQPLPTQQHDPYQYLQEQRPQNQYQYGQQIHQPPRVYLPIFEGARSWIQKCEHYFSVYQVTDWYKVELSAMHLRGRAESWYNSFLVNRGQVSWQEWIQEIVERFEVRNVVGVVDEFNHLRQRGSLEEYK
jgi:hypothetical protein